MLRRRLIVSSAFLALLLPAACDQKKPVAPPQPPPAATDASQVSSCPPGLVMQAPPEGEIQALTAKAEEQGKVRVIARLASVVTTQSLSTAQTAAVRSLSSSGISGATLISPRLPLVVAELDAAQLAKMAADPQFDGITEDRIAFPTLAQSVPLIQAPQVWAIGGRGAGQAIAILDTGVDRNHPFLAGRVVSEACFSTTSAVSGSTSACPNGEATQTGPSSAAPCSASGCEHGTHVAGIAAGKGTDFSGVAPDADIIAVQVFSKFTGPACGGAPSCVASFTSDQIRALDYVLQQSAQRPVASANMSLGGGRSRVVCDTDATKPVIDQLRAAGVAVAIASGNNGYRDSVSFPGCISSAVTVGATTKDDQLAEFSNCGPQVDLHAPGANINSSVPGDRFAVFSGTSMATPHIAGAFAVLKSLRPRASVDELEMALKTSGFDVGGRPRIRLFEANNALVPVSSQDPVVAVSSADTPQTPPQAPSGSDRLSAAMQELSALPPDTAVRIIVGVPATAQSSGANPALARAEAAAKTAGIAQVQRLGGQPLLAIECTAKQARDLAASGAIASLQIDRVANTQN